MKIREVSASEGEKLIDFMVRAEVAESKADARRKAEQGGVSIDGEKLSEDTILTKENHDGKVMKVGKKDFVKITFSA